jgi:hypothetical protein
MPPIDKDKTLIDNNNSGYPNLGEGGKAVDDDNFIEGTGSVARKIVTGTDTAVVGTSATDTFTISDGTTSNFTFAPATGDYSTYGYLSFMQNIKLSNKIILEERKGNVLVIPEKNIVIHWDSEYKIWACSEINEFIYDLRVNGEVENPYDSHRDFGSSKIDLLLSFFINSNGNYYLDLDNQNYYQYNSETKKWNKLEGNISSLSFSRKYKINSLKQRKKERILLCEKMPKLKLSFYGDTLMGEGYVFAPYVPMTTGTILTMGNTTTTPNITISDRYTVGTTINSDLYGTVTLGDNAGTTALT